MPKNNEMSCTYAQLEIGQTFYRYFFDAEKGQVGVVECVLNRRRPGHGTSILVDVTYVDTGNSAEIQVNPERRAFLVYDAAMAAAVRESVSWMQNTAKLMAKVSYELSLCCRDYFDNILDDFASDPHESAQEVVLS